MRQRVFGGEERAFDVHGDHRIEHLLGEVGNGRHRAEIAGIAEQDVDLAEPADGRGDAGLDLIGLGHVGGAGGEVALNIAVDGAGSPLQRGFAQIGEHHLGALGQQEFGRGKPDAARPAGDHANLVLHLLRHVFPRFGIGT